MLISEQWPDAFYPALRYSDEVTMRVPLYHAESQQILVARNQQIRFRKGGAFQKHIVVRITAYLYRTSNLHADATRQNRLQRRCCPVLLPGKLFRQNAMSEDVIAICDEIDAEIVR